MQARYSSSLRSFASIEIVYFSFRSHFIFGLPPPPWFMVLYVNDSTHSFAIHLWLWCHSYSSRGSWFIMDFSCAQCYTKYILMISILILNKWKIVHRQDMIRCMRFIRNICIASRDNLFHFFSMILILVLSCKFQWWFQ